MLQGSRRTVPERNQNLVPRYVPFAIALSTPNRFKDMLHSHPISSRLRDSSPVVFMRADREPKMPHPRADALTFSFA